MVKCIDIRCNQYDIAFMLEWRHSAATSEQHQTWGIILLEENVNELITEY